MTYTVEVNRSGEARMCCKRNESEDEWVEIRGCERDKRFDNDQALLQGIVQKSSICSEGSKTLSDRDGVVQ